MEKAILKTLIYYDIFNFPLKAWEIHKWLIANTATLKQIEKTLKKMSKESKIKYQGDYWFLNSKKGLVKERAEKEKTSKIHFQTAKQISQLFKLVPWIKLVGVSGSLSMMASSKKDDIDLFIITSQNRIWISRLLLIFLTSLTGKRRKRHEKKLSANGKICINLILEENNLGLNKRDIYRSHEVLQMKVLWQRDEVYSEFLHANSWAFKYLPNWKSTNKMAYGAWGIGDRKKQKTDFDNFFIEWLEGLAKNLQLKIMGTPDKSERIENGALYFHPEDKGIKILEEYKKRIESLK